MLIIFMFDYAYSATTLCIIGHKYFVNSLADVFSLEDIL